MNNDSPSENGNEFRTFERHCICSLPNYARGAIQGNETVLEGNGGCAIFIALDVS